MLTNHSKFTTFQVYWTPKSINTYIHNYLTNLAEFMFAVFAVRLAWLLSGDQCANNFSIPSVRQSKTVTKRIFYSRPTISITFSSWQSCANTRYLNRLSVFRMTYGTISMFTMFKTFTAFSCFLKIGLNTFLLC